MSALTEPLFDEVDFETALTLQSESGQEEDEGDERTRRLPENDVYTDDNVRVYLREMGTVPLLTREGEIDLAKRMERGQLRARKTISRSALIQKMAAEEICRQVKEGVKPLDNFVDFAGYGIKEGTPAYLAAEKGARDRLYKIGEQYKKLEQVNGKLQ